MHPWCTVTPCALRHWCMEALGSQMFLATLYRSTEHSWFCPLYPPIAYRYEFRHTSPAHRKSSVKHPSYTFLTATHSWRSPLCSDLLLHLTQAAAGGAHWRQLLPGVGVGLVPFSSVPAGLPVVSPHHIEKPSARCDSSTQTSHRHGADEGPAVGLRVPPATRKLSTYVQDCHGNH